MKPVVVLVGRPNVGKSTLFNRLTRSREALVADEPGLTRDRLYGVGRIGDRPYIVVDTGGLDREQQGVQGLMSAQTRQAMAEADAIVFIADGRAGVTALDRDLALELRRLGKPVTLAVNKTEGMDAEIANADFHALGYPPVSISAAHGAGVAQLMRAVLTGLPVAAEEAPAEAVPRVAIVGRPNVGKSTLLNAMLGEERVVVFDQPGTTRDSVRVPFERGRRRYVLIDTAGMRRQARIVAPVEKFSIVKTLQAVDEANVVILVLDAQQEVSDQDAALAGFVLERGRSLVIAVNKWDGLDASRRDWIKRELQRKLAFLAFARTVFISALHGTGVAALFPAVDRAYASALGTIATSRLNRILGQAVQATPPPMVRGRRIKLKFAHQGGKNPPLVVIHGNQVDAVPEAYCRYLANVFRTRLKLEGTPVRIEFRQGENPFLGRRARPARRPRKSRRQ